MHPYAASQKDRTQHLQRSPTRTHKRGPPATQSHTHTTTQRHSWSHTHPHTHTHNMPTKGKGKCKVTAGLMGSRKTLTREPVTGHPGNGYESDTSMVMTNVVCAIPPSSAHTTLPPELARELAWFNALYLPLLSPTLIEVALYTLVCGVQDLSPPAEHYGKMMWCLRELAAFLPGRTVIKDTWADQFEAPSTPADTTHSATQTPTTEPPQPTQTYSEAATQVTDQPSTPRSYVEAATSTTPPPTIKRKNTPPHLQHNNPATRGNNKSPTKTNNQLPVRMQPH